MKIIVMKKIKFKLQSLFLCGALALAGCNMPLMPPEINGIVYQGSQSSELQSLVEQVRNSNEYGSYIIQRMEELGVIITVGDTGSWGGLYSPSRNMIILNETSLTPSLLVHEMIHRLQEDTNFTYNKLYMNVDEYKLMSLYSEFDAEYKAKCFQYYDNLDNKVPFLTEYAGKIFREYYADKVLSSIPYDKYLAHYNDKLYADKYDPEDLQDNIDKTFIDYDEEYILNQINERIK